MAVEHLPAVSDGPVNEDSGVQKARAHTVSLHLA